MFLTLRCINDHTGILGNSEVLLKPPCKRRRCRGVAARGNSLLPPAPPPFASEANRETPTRGDNAAPVERDHTSHPRLAALRGGRRARPTPPLRPASSSSSSHAPLSPEGTPPPRGGYGRATAPRCGAAPLPRPPALTPFPRAPPSAAPLPAPAAPLRGALWE